MKKSLPIIVAIVVIVTAIGASAYLLRNKKINYDFTTVEKKNLQSEVRLTGTVRPADSVDLGFERSGRVVKVSADVGTTVQAGQVLASLDTSDIAAQLEQAQAALAAQQARLVQLQHGARPEDIAVQQTSVTNAQAALDEAKLSLVNRMKDSFAAADDAVNGKTDAMLINPHSFSPLLNFSATNTQAKADAESQRAALNTTFDAWKSLTDSLTIDSDLTADVALVRTNTDTVRAYLDKLSDAVSSIIITESVPQPTADGYKATLSAARSGLTAASANLLTAENGMQSAQSGLTLANDQLTLKKSGASSDDLAIQTAQVQQAQAAVNALEVQDLKTALHAPIAGTITKKSISVGEIVSPGAPAFSLISAAQFEIQSAVSEADIAKVAVSQHAVVTLDAYGSATTFDALVTKVDPVETQINGVGAYLVTLQFAQADDRVKSDMTANINIVTSEKNDALAVPERAIIKRNADSFVLVDTGKGEPEERQVEVGITSPDGFVEITKGLAEGNKILSFSTRQ